MVKVFKQNIQIVHIRRTFTADKTLAAQQDRHLFSDVSLDPKPAEAVENDL